MELNKLMTKDEIVDYLSISKSTLYKYTSARKIPFIKMGKHLRFDRIKIDAWLDSQAVPAV